MTVLMERIKTWWREAERRERHRRLHPYFELGGKHPEEEWLVNLMLPTNRYYYFFGSF